jgi:hypothetical protein
MERAGRGAQWRGGSIPLPLSDAISDPARRHRVDREGSGLLSWRSFVDSGPTRREPTRAVASLRPARSCGTSMSVKEPPGSCRRTPPSRCGFITRRASSELAWHFPFVSCPEDSSVATFLVGDHKYGCCRCEGEAVRVCTILCCGMTGDGDGLRAGCAASILWRQAGYVLGLARACGRARPEPKPVRPTDCRSPSGSSAGEADRLRWRGAAFPIQTLISIWRPGSLCHTSCTDCNDDARLGMGHRSSAPSRSQNTPFESVSRMGGEMGRSDGDWRVDWECTRTRFFTVRT